MSRLSSLVSEFRKPSHRRNRTRPALEVLEDRMVPTVMISVADTTAIEGDRATRFIDDFVTTQSGGLSGPRHILFGPDWNGDDQSDLYVPSRWTNQVLSYDGISGAFLGVVIDSNAGCLAPWAMALGPDGNIYVGGGESSNVVRYTFSTGLTDEYVPSGSGGLSAPRGLTFGPDNSLYVSSPGPGGVNDEVLRYQGPSGQQPGQFTDIFVTNGSGGGNALDIAKGLAFGPDGNLYVSSGVGDSVNRYNGTTGAFMDVFVPTGSGGLGNPNFLAFRPDGFLYVSSQDAGEVLRYNSSSGAFVDVVVPSVTYATSGLAWDSNGNLCVGVGASDAESKVVRFGPASQAAFTVSLSESSATAVTVEYTTTAGTAQAGSDYTTETGTLTFAPGQICQTILVQTLDDTTGEPTESFTVTLSNPVGGTITDDTAVGTILDNETKFFVVDDAATNLTFEHATSGNAIENYSLTAANSAPRGAASTAAGDKVWVVDANKKVYVYNASGGLLGSWTVGSLTPNAAVEGISTNGTDIWIVDARQDKVYMYMKSTSRLSGSQNAVMSFNLNNSNRDPKDIVTDGTSIWVVNDSTTDKVFKYTLSGALLGSWTIDSANTSPTGITLDPTSVSHLWIVDNGTDRVYQYDNAAGRTSGSQSASTNFALAPGNTNPQGIADPPVGGQIVLPPKHKKPHSSAASLADQIFSMNGSLLTSDVLEALTSFKHRRR